MSLAASWGLEAFLFTHGVCGFSTQNFEPRLGGKPLNIGKRQKRDEI
jgi:hypothetical protein